MLSNSFKSNVRRATFRSAEDTGKGRPLGLSDEFSRRRLENLPVKIKRQHQGDVGFGEAAAVAVGEISSQLLPKFLAVSGSDLAVLLELDNTSADLQ